MSQTLTNLQEVNLHRALAIAARQVHCVSMRFYAFVSTVALGTIAGLVAGVATWLAKDVDFGSVVFLFGYFAAFGGGFGVASGFLSSLLVVDRISPLQIVFVFAGVTVCSLTILWNPNFRPVAVQVIGLSLVQPLLCIPVGIVLRSTASS